MYAIGSLILALWWLKNICLAENTDLERDQVHVAQCLFPPSIHSDIM